MTDQSLPPGALTRVREALAAPSSTSGSQLIGEYRILKRIDESKGGMGLVYEAIHERVGLRVALKLIKPGRMSADMLRRFEYEARVLARLEHPGIARIHYAGIWDCGAGAQPYFAMEFVEGKALDQFVKSQNPPLKLREVVELYSKICQAVQHAHGKGIVHRDLKPDNILVTSDGTPKILDFGIARSIDADAQVTTQHTETGQLIGTVPYMAPEQVRGEVDALDEATDVYALGVIGYELIGGRMPYAVKGRPLPEAARIICEEEPSRLSSINKSLRGDVETIIQKALEKDKSRRFANAAQLAGQIRRYLNYEPLTIRPPSTWYQISKFAKRNRILVGGIAATFVVLIAGSIVSSVLYLRAERQRREAQNQTAIAEAVSEFQDKMLASANPEELGEQATVLQVVQAAVQLLDAGELDKTPLVEAAVRGTIGRTFLSLARYAEAEKNLLRARDLTLTLRGPTSIELAACFNHLALLRRSQGNLPEAHAFLEESLRIRRAALPPEDESIASDLNAMGSILRAEGNFEESEASFRNALLIQRTIAPTGDRHVGATLNNLGVLLRDKGNKEEALAVYRESLEILRRTLPPLHLDVARAVDNVASMLPPPEAEPLHREALGIRKKALPANHPDIADSLNNVGMVLRDQGKLPEAESMLREAVRIDRHAHAGDHNDTARSLNNLSSILREQDQLPEAETVCREALEMRRRLFGPNHPTVALNANSLARLLVKARKPDQAEPLFREALEICRHKFGPHATFTKQSALALVVFLEDANRMSEAAALRREYSLADAAIQPAMVPSTAPTTRP